MNFACNIYFKHNKFDKAMDNIQQNADAVQKGL